MTVFGLCNLLFGVKRLQGFSHSVCLVPVQLLREHESTFDRKVREVRTSLRSCGVLRRPIVVDLRTMVVLDGHHRLNAVRSLGLRRIPVLLVDYESEDVEVFPRRDEIVVSKSRVIRAAVNGRTYPPKTTRHELSFDVEPVDVSIEKLR